MGCVSSSQNSVDEKQEKKAKPEVNGKANAVSLLSEPITFFIPPYSEPSTEPTTDSTTEPTTEPNLTYRDSDTQPRAFTCKEFRLKEIIEATCDFNGDYYLGRGGFGIVYKGELKINGGVEKTQVAIKRLKKDSKQGKQEWLAEIMTIGRLSHSNLVKLYGYCAEEEEGILIYEYIPLGSLNYHLFPSDNTTSPSHLSWERRVRIAHGLASGLAYLHDKKIIHRDFKASNILLDANFNPVLTDFGLAKVLTPEATHASTRIMGSLGYIDPMFCETGQLTTKSDVYAYGVLLLELVSGRKAKQGDVTIVEWAEPYISQQPPDIPMLLDPSLVPDVSSEKVMQKIVKKILVVIRYCVELEPSSRPSMQDMLEILTPLINKLDQRLKQ